MVFLLQRQTQVKLPKGHPHQSFCWCSVLLLSESKFKDKHPHFEGRRWKQARESPLFGNFLFGKEAILVDCESQTRVWTQSWTRVWAWSLLFDSKKLIWENCSQQDCKICHPLQCTEHTTLDLGLGSESGRPGYKTCTANIPLLSVFMSRWHIRSCLDVPWSLLA